jgi:hypothetical protein
MICDSSGTGIMMEWERPVRLFVPWYLFLPEHRMTDILFASHPTKSSARKCSPPLG